MTKEQICALRERAVWKKLSSELNTAWTPKFVSEMKDHLDWKELYQSASYEDQEFYLKEFFEYVSQLPFNESSWRRSRFFDEYVDAQWKERAAEILSHVK